MITASDIRFDVEKEARVSLKDSKEIISIDIDKVGDRYRAIINTEEYWLPDYVQDMTAARRIVIKRSLRMLRDVYRQYQEMLEDIS
jgi:hypothetical protein